MKPNIIPFKPAPETTEPKPAAANPHDTKPRVADPEALWAERDREALGEDVDLEKVLEEGAREARERNAGRAPAPLPFHCVEALEKGSIKL